MVFANSPYREHVDCKVRFSRSPFTFRALFDILEMPSNIETKNEDDRLCKSYTSNYAPVGIGGLITIRIQTWPPNRELLSIFKVEFRFPFVNIDPYF